MGTDNTCPGPGGLASDPAFQAAVLGAMYGDPSHLAGFDGEQLRFAARSICVLVAGRVVQCSPCDLAGVTFYVESGVVTFTPHPDATHDPVAQTIARMVAVDASALLERDIGDATHAMWVDLWESVPGTHRRHLALRLGAQWTALPARPDTHPGDPRAAA